MADYQAPIRLSLEAETLRASKAYQGMVTNHRVRAEGNRHIHLDNPSTKSSRGTITFDPENPWMHYSTIEDNGNLDVTLYEDGTVEFSLKPFLFEMKQTSLRRLFGMGPKVKKKEDSTPTEGRSNGVDFSEHYQTARRTYNVLETGEKLSEYPLPKKVLDELVASMNTL